MVKRKTGSPSHPLKKKQKNKSPNSSSSSSPSPQQQPSIRSLKRAAAAKSKQKHKKSQPKPPSPRKLEIRSKNPKKCLRRYHHSRNSNIQNFFLINHTERVFSTVYDIFKDNWESADKESVFYKMNSDEEMVGWAKRLGKLKKGDLLSYAYWWRNTDGKKYPDSAAGCLRFIRNFLEHCNKCVEELWALGYSEVKKLSLEERVSLMHKMFPELFDKVDSVFELENEINVLKMLNVESERLWTSLTDDDYVSKFDDTFVVLSLNLLPEAMTFEHPDWYTKSEYLDRENQIELICDELERYQAGIICFQQVDRFEELQVLLQKYRYQGIHKSCTVDGHWFDGCSIFWKRSLFKLLAEEAVEFNESIGLKNKVALLCVLEMRSCQRKIVVGNIDLVHDPLLGDVKLGQMRVFLERAHKLSRAWKDVPVVLTVNLNSTPKSAIYQYVASSKCDINTGQLCGSDASEPLWTPNAREIATGLKDGCVMTHGLQLSSAYPGVPGSKTYRDEYGEPVATRHHGKFTGTVDYIWHTSGVIPLQVLETLPMSRLKETGGLPAERWGSDHLAVACEFGFSTSSSG